MQCLNLTSDGLWRATPPVGYSPGTSKSSPTSKATRRRRQSKLKPLCILAGSRNCPATRMALHADFGIVSFGGRSGHQCQGGAFTRPCTSFRYQSFTDALMLIRSIYREIGKIAAIGEIGDSARDAVHRHVPLQ